MSRPDVGFVLNNKWRFVKGEDLLSRIQAVMGSDVAGRMLDINASSNSTVGMTLSGFVSEPTLRRASSVDQYLFVNGRSVKDKVLVSALRAAYMDVMHAREFPLCALYLTLPTNAVDVNVSPAKTDVHFLEPAHVRSFIIKTLRDRLAQTMVSQNKVELSLNPENNFPESVSMPRFDFGLRPVQMPMMAGSCLRDNLGTKIASVEKAVKEDVGLPSQVVDNTVFIDLPLGRVVGQVANKYIIAQKDDNMVVIDQHAAHERITYEKLRNNKMKSQPLLTPIIVNLRDEDVMSIVSIADELKRVGLYVDAFGDDAVAIFEKPSDWDLNWSDVLRAIADEVRAYGHSSQLSEKLHLKLANYACHHSVRAGQKLDFAQMDALLRAIENTERAGQCNHGRPVYKFIPMSEIDAWFERL